MRRVTGNGAQVRTAAGGWTPPRVRADGPEVKRSSGAESVSMAGIAVTGLAAVADSVGAAGRRVQNNTASSLPPVQENAVWNTTIISYYHRLYVFLYIGVVFFITLRLRFIFFFHIILCYISWGSIYVILLLLCTRVRNTDSIRVTWCCLRLVELIFDNRINNARISNFFQQWVVHFGFIAYAVPATRFISYLSIVTLHVQKDTSRHVLQKKKLCTYDKTKSINITIKPNPTCTSKYIFLQ